MPEVTALCLLREQPSLFSPLALRVPHDFTQPFPNGPRLLQTQKLKQKPLHLLRGIKCCGWMFPTKDIAVSGWREELYNARGKSRSTSVPRPPPRPPPPVLTLGAPREKLKNGPLGTRFVPWLNWPFRLNEARFMFCRSRRAGTDRLTPFATLRLFLRSLRKTRKSREVQAGTSLRHHFFFASIWPKPFWGNAAIPTSEVGRRASQSQLCLGAVILHLKKPALHCFISSSGEPNVKGLPVRMAISSAPRGQDKLWEQHF